MICLIVKYASARLKPSGPLSCISKIQCAFLVTILIFALPLATEAIEFGSPSIETRIDYISSADEEGSGPSGEVAVTSAGGTASMPFQLADKLNLTFELSGNRIFFDWDNTENLKFSNGRKPWDDFNSARVRLKLNYNWNPQWTSFANVHTAAGWEEEMDDSYSYGASIGTVFQSPYNLRWTLGACSGEGPENGYWGVFGGVAWNQHKKEEGQPGIFASLNWPPAAEIGTVLNKKWLLRWNLWQSGGIFRLADDNALSPSGLVVASVERTGLFVEYKPIRKFTVTLGGSYVFRHQYEIQNENGNKIQSNLHIDAALGATLNFKFNF